MNPANNRFAVIEVGRGIAALLVVLFHMDAFYFAQPGYWSQQLFGGAFAFGAAGVQFFFVLSGYVMVWAHYGDLGQREAVWPFVLKRIIRIYPLAIATVIAATVLFLLSDVDDPTRTDPFVLLQSLLLVGIEPLLAINFPTWTLWHENVFYVFCALMIASPRLGAVAFVIWTMACAGMVMVGDDRAVYYMVRPINVLFGLGVACAFFLKRATMPMPGIALAVGTVLFFGYGTTAVITPFDNHVEFAIFGIASALIITGGVELQRRGTIAPSGWAGILGNLSYPIYLTHMIVLTVISKAMQLGGMPQVLPWWIAAAVMLVATIIIAFATHYLFEKPVTRWLRKRLLPARVA